MQAEAGRRDLSRLVITETMHERKKVMFMNADAIAILPGGAGSLDEFFEVLTWAQLGLHAKPILLVDIEGYWQRLIALIDHAVAEGFADPGLKAHMTALPDVPALFGVQHSVMARPAFKAVITRFVPQSIERATYVLASSVAFVLMFVAWQPMPTALWQTEGALTALLQAGALLGFGIVLVTTFLIDHFDLFGLRQVWLAFRGKPYSEKRFVTPGPYRYIRHPLYVGWILAFCSAPTMTVGHALLAIGMTSYILVAIRYEERDLLALLGEPYRRWRAATPMLIPHLRPRPAAPSPARTAEASRGPLQQSTCAPRARRKKEIEA
jgi:protein-S-isoprenylcysteine O-methyltransferase Ste14